MPWDSQANNDAVGVRPSEQAAGPRLGFLEAWDAANDQRMRAESRDGLAYFFMKLDDEQADRAHKAGKAYTPMYQQLVGPNIDDSVKVQGPDGQNVPQFKSFIERRNAYKDMADSIVHGTDNGWAEYMRKHDDTINALNKEDPTLGLKTTTQMFEEVKASAQRAEARGHLTTTWGGMIGGFAGGTLASVDPRTDPFNFATLPVGGFGKAGVTRIATQAAGQGAIEAVDQLTGVQGNRELLGLSHGASDAFFNIAGAAVGGAAIQGVGEAALAGLRKLRTGKWFADAPHDPAPPAPVPDQTAAPVRTGPTPEFEAAWSRVMATEQKSPLFAHMMGRPRAEVDMSHVAEALSDWGGPRAWEIQPKDGYRLNVERGPESLDSIARRLDPEAFNSYDKLTAMREEVRAELKNPEEITRVADTAAAASETRAQIAQLRSQLDTTTGKAAKRIQQRIDDMEADYAKAFAKADTAAPGSPEELMHNTQQKLLNLEKDLRDLSPTIKRAYARAQNKWDVYKSQHDQIDAMVKSGAPGLGETRAPLSYEDADTMYPVSTRELVPELQSVKLRPGETVAQAILRNTEETRKSVEDALAVFQGTVGKLSDMEHVKTERVKLDKSIETLQTKLADKELKGKDRKLVEHELKDIQDQREALDTFKVKVGDREHTLSLDADKIVMPDGKGGTRVVTARELLKDIEDDNNMLKAVTTCSLKETS